MPPANWVSSRKPRLQKDNDGRRREGRSRPFSFVRPARTCTRGPLNFLSDCFGSEADVGYRPEADNMVDCLLGGGRALRSIQAKPSLLQDSIAFFELSLPYVKEVLCRRNTLLTRLHPAYQSLWPG